MIPKTIHFIWLGKNKIDKQSLICINAAKNNLPNYRIKIWNEQNLDLDSIVKENDFVKECLKRKLWAFVSDYLRLYVLYKHGGIYLDTDVQVIRSFNNEMLSKSFIVGLEENNYIGTGLIGAEKNNKIIKKLLNFYDNDIWNVDYFNNPIIFKNVLKSINLKQYNGYIYPREYFSPYSPNQKSLYIKITKNTVCIHWYNANWGMSRTGYVFLQTKHYKNPVIKMVQILKKNIGYYRKIYFRST
ncbi:glycosyltransferase family 32 protein [Limosilactobacillus reuteri]|uniref:glycosyltransferase family 32 protein n=1 Tax=Limosilactobacillus reuteri TaxID=1598 RepID=UPI0039955825